jgi:hypothetical protein
MNKLHTYNFIDRGSLGIALALFCVSFCLLFLNYIINGNFLYLEQDAQSTSAMLVLSSGAFILFGIVITLCDYAIASRKITKEYQKGYSDYPHSALYDSVKHIRGQKEISLYREGFNDAKREQMKQQNDKKVEEFKKYVN